MNITPILSALITLIAAVISAFAVPYIKSRTTAAQREELARWVQIAVQAAEQLFDSGMGVEKKRFALDFLKKQGYATDFEALGTMIEAEVLKLAQLVK